MGSNLASSFLNSPNTHGDYLTSPTSNTMALYPTTPHEVNNIISNLNNNTSYGYDSITSSVVKLAAPCICGPLSYIINYSFDTGLFPDMLKIGKICPIFKNGDKKLITNYRPISLLPVFSKIYKRAIYTRLDSFLTANETLVDCQYGFRKGFSTYMPIQDIYNKISLASQNNEYVIAIFLDLAKVFDTINIIFHVINYIIMMFGVLLLNCSKII